MFSKGRIVSSATKSNARGTSGRWMIAIVSAGIVFIGLIVIDLWPREQHAEPRRGTKQTTLPAADAPPSAEGVRRTESKSVAPAPRPPVIAPSAAAQPPINLFDGPAPELISKAYQVVANRRSLQSDRLKEIYDYAKSHPGDARPYLIMAMDSMNRGWYAFAAGHYANAAKEDPRAKQDPGMLRDLVFIAGRQHDFERAQTALIDLYGASALSAVTAALDEASSAGDTAKQARLASLLATLEQGGH